MVHFTHFLSMELILCLKKNHIPTARTAAILSYRGHTAQQLGAAAYSVPVEASTVVASSS